ncbi:MAG: fluoride efflux transporter CrcB [Pseudomonadota bacterium]
MNALAVAGGAAIGALLRWWLGLGLNAIWPMLPLGTLLANWIGGYVIGVLAALISLGAGLSEPMRLFLITGLLGGLTTFSTFSLEALTLLQRQLFGPALLHIGLHLGGSLLLTLAGYASVQAVRG